MKMIKHLVNLGKRALLLDKIGVGASYLQNKTRALFALRGSEKATRFEELPLYGVTPAQIRLCKKQFFKLACFYFGFAILLFLYVGLMIAKRHFSIAIMVSSLVALCLAQAFRYHFWYFQIREQRLGCTFSEWLKFVLRKTN